jgi:hypothetical protein
MDVGFDKGPPTVRPKCLARPMVELDGDTKSESGCLESEIETSGSGEQTDYGWYWH